MDSNRRTNTTFSKRANLSGLKSKIVLYLNKNKKIFEKLKSPLDKFKSRVITGLDIKDGMIKLVQLKPTPLGLQLMRCILKKVNLGSDSSEEEKKEDILVKTLKKILVDNKIKVRNLVTAIPRQAAVVRYITLPSKDDAEIKQMIKFEAERHIPFTIDKVEIDFQIIEKRVKESKIILVAVKRELLNKHLSLLKKANLIPEIIDLSSFAIFNSFINSGDQLANRGVTALVDVGREVVEINIVRDGLLYFTRSAWLNSKDDVSVSKRTLWRQRLLSEIRRSFDVFEIESPGVEINQVILSGGDEKLDDLRDFLEKNLEIKIQQANAFSKIQLICPLADEQNLASRMSIPLGLALRKSIKNKIEINLLPDEVIKERTKQKNKRILKFSSFLIGFLISLIVTIMLAFLSIREAKFEKLERKIKKLEPSAREVKKMQTQIELIASYTGNQTLPLEILKDLSLPSVIPSQVYLTKLVFEKDKSVNIRGMATSHSAVSQIIVNLERLSYLKNVERKFSRANRMGGKELVEFEIYCSLATGKQKVKNKK